MKGGIIKKTFCIKGEFYKTHTFPGLNEYIAQLGRHPKAGNRMKQEMMMVAINSIQTQLGRWKTDKPVIIHYQFCEPNKGIKRDVMNVFSFADKVIEDALVKAGVIQDDNPKYVRNTTHDFVYGPEPYIIVCIEELA